jgi:Protease inhibitor Inh
MKAMGKIMAACRRRCGRGMFGQVFSAPIGLAVAVFAVLFTAPRAEAVVLANDEAAVGQWDLSLGESARKCRVSLRPEAAGNGHLLSMPAGCRRALPILVEASSWSVPAQDHLDLADASGKPVLDFIASGADGFLAQGPQGETYRFVAVGPAKRNFSLIGPDDARPAQGFEPVKVAAGTTKTNVPGPQVKAGDIAGRYAILREGGKDTGCMLTLDAGGNKASLAPACRDQGIVTFDPTGWQIVAGRLVLRARRGHSTHLDLQTDGTWTKDPGEGKLLILKKM